MAGQSSPFWRGSLNRSRTVSHTVSNVVALADVVRAEAFASCGSARNFLDDPAAAAAAPVSNRKRRRGWDFQTPRSPAVLDRNDGPWLYRSDKYPSFAIETLQLHVGDDAVLRRTCVDQAFGQQQRQAEIM